MDNAPAAVCIGEIETLVRHQLTPEETAKGAKKSARVRKGIAKQASKLLGMKIEAGYVDAAINAVTVWASTPVGQLLIGLGFIELGGRAGFFKHVPGGAEGIAAVLLSVDVLQALGASGIVTQGATLASTITKAASSAPAALAGA